MIFKPLAWNSLYNATTFGFSFLQGPHQDAQKSIIVSFPKALLSEVFSPTVLGAEKLGAIVPISTAEELLSFFFYLNYLVHLKFF